MSTEQTSSLLKTKNSTKLVKRFLQRTSDWHTSATTTTSSTEENAEQTRLSKKRKRKLEAQLALEAAPAMTKEEIVERHIQTMLSVDQTMDRPPTKSMKKRVGKASNMDISRKRLDRDDRHTSRKRQFAKEYAPVGSSRSSAIQSRTLHTKTFNKKDHELQTKQKSVQRIAKLLKKQQVKRLKRAAKK